MLTFKQFKEQVRAVVFPAGEAVNLVAAHDKMFIDALVDLQTWVDCLQRNNTTVYDQCATYYNCGLTVLDAPRGYLNKLSVLDRVNSTTGEEDAASPVDWCSEIIYTPIDPCNIRCYLNASRSRGCCLPIPIFFCLPSSACHKGLYPIPTDEGVPAGLPALPLGFHYPQTSTDRSYGRAGAGVWAVENGKIFIAPWIQSTEQIVIRWDGIKTLWDEQDQITDDPQVARAVRYFLLAEHAANYDNDYAAADMFRAHYTEARSILMHECEKQHRLEACKPSKARGDIQGGLSALFYNDQQQATAACPQGQTGDPVTVTIPAGVVGSTISKDDANARALTQAQTQAQDALECENVVVTYTNTNGGQIITVTCTGDPDAPTPTGSPSSATIPSGVMSTESEAAANAAAEDQARQVALAGLRCTFYNRAQTYSKTCLDTSIQTKTVAASTYSAETQDEADALAMSEAVRQATEACGDPIPNTPVETEWIKAAMTCMCDWRTPNQPAPWCSGNTNHIIMGMVRVKVTVAGGRFTGATQQEANDLALAQATAYAHAKMNALSGGMRIPPWPPPTDEEQVWDAPGSLVPGAWIPACGDRTYELP